LLWVDPDAGVALAGLSGENFGPWAKASWPPLSDVVVAYATSRDRTGPARPDYRAGSIPTVKGAAPEVPVGG
jgi:hypothetical protein